MAAAGQPDVGGAFPVPARRCTSTSIEQGTHLFDKKIISANSPDVIVREVRGQQSGAVRDPGDVDASHTSVQLLGYSDRLGTICVPHGIITQAGLADSAAPYPCGRLTADTGIVSSSLPHVTEPESLSGVYNAAFASDSGMSDPIKDTTTAAAAATAATPGAQHRTCNGQLVRRDQTAVLN